MSKGTAPKHKHDPDTFTVSGEYYKVIDLGTIDAAVTQAQKIANLYAWKEHFLAIASSPSPFSGLVSPPDDLAATAATADPANDWLPGEFLR